MISSPEAVGPVKNNILGVYIGLWGGGGGSENNHSKKN